MERNGRHLLFAGIAAGSLWGFAEVVLGAGIRSLALPLRGTALTTIGVVVLFALFALGRRVWPVAVALVTVLVIKVVCAIYLGGLDSVINSSLAVMLEGLLILLAIFLLKNIIYNDHVFQSALAGIGMLVAGTLFYFIGSHLAPCKYLSSMSAGQFFVHETLFWSAVSAVGAPLGYFVGRHIRENTVAPERRVIPAMITSAICWAACALAVHLF
jgi:hypothetical protein